MYQVIEVKHEEPVAPPSPPPPQPHPSQRQYWYPDDQSDNMSRRVNHGYDFNYPKDQYIDGYLIEKFNTLMSSFHKRQAKLHSLATT